MTAVLVPPAGYEWRGARAGDAAALIALFEAVDAVEGLDEVLGPQAVGHVLSYPGLDASRDTLIAFRDGAACGFIWVLGQPPTEPERARLLLEAHPDHLPLEPFLLEWAEARARRRFAAGTGRGVLRLHVEEHRLRRQRVLEETGYGHVRTFAEMRRPLVGPLPPALPLPAGLEMVAWDPRFEEPARRAANEAFALHWGQLPVPPDLWRAGVTGDPNFRPDLSRLAVIGEEVIGLCLVGVDTEYNARRGVAEIWLERISTVPAYHRRGVASALITEALRVGAQAGFTQAGLGVDQENTTGANLLYERLGFRLARRTFTYQKDVG